jgi:hypothetical protein
MIVRELDTGIIVKIPNINDEDEFLSVNPTGGFFKVVDLPPSASQEWIRNEANEIISNKEADDIIANNMYKDARKAEYPDFFEYLDGLVKNDQDQINSYLNKCIEVKLKYPKP